MKRRGFMYQALILAAIFFITGCAGSISNEKTEPAKDDMEGNIIVWSRDKDIEAISDAAGRFMKNHTSVKIDIKSFSKAEAYARLEAGLNSGAELPDILTIDIQLIRSYVSKYPKAFTELTADIGPLKDKFIKPLLGEVSVNDKIMAIPWDSAPAVVFYRKDILEQAGIKIEDIRTWSEYIEAGQLILKKYGGKVKMLALDKKNDDSFFRMLLNQSGAGYYNKSGKFMLGSPESIRAMSMVKQIHEAGIAYEVSDLDDIITAAKDGKIAAVPIDPSFGNLLIERCKELKGKWEVMHLPAFEPGGKTAASFGGSALMLPKKSQVNKAVKEFAKYITIDKDSVTHSVIEAGIVPSLLEYYDETWVDTRVEFFNYQRLWRIITEISREQIEINYTEEFREVQKEVLEAQKKILFDKKDVNEAMEDIEKQMLKKSIDKQNSGYGR